MQAYEVGKLYNPNRNRWPEAAQYNFRGGEHELVLFFNAPTKREVRAVGNERAEFALYLERGQIVFLYRFGEAVPWSDAPYSIHLVPPEDRTLPEDTGEYHVLLHIILVDAGTGIIQAMRVIGMPPEFVRVLHAAIVEQAGTPFTRSRYNETLDSLFARFSSSQLANMAAVRFSSTQK